MIKVDVIVSEIMASKVLGRWLGVEHQLKRYLATQASVKGIHMLGGDPQTDLSDN